MYGYRKKKQMYDYDQCEEMIKKETERQADIFLNKIKEEEKRANETMGKAGMFFDGFKSALEIVKKIIEKNKITI